MSSPTLALFPTHNSDGADLRDKLIPLAETLGFTFKDVGNSSNKLEYANACWNDDVVVLDASIGDTGTHNYDIAFPALMDHVLVVSRTYLPINFYGMRIAS
jgi:hypothetical protein